MKTKRLCHMALLTALALIIFMVEAQLPQLAPVPGMKLGLANIITVYAMAVMGPGDTLMILLARIFLGSVFSGQMTTIFYSFAGGMFCYCTMLLLRKLLKPHQLWLGSVFGAMSHNVGQLFAAMIIMKTTVVWLYLPALLAVSVLTGALTGLAAQFVVSRLPHMTYGRNAT